MHVSESGLTMKSKKKKQKLFDSNKERGIKFTTNSLQLSDYQRDYFVGYPYGHWLHKGLALMYFIEDRSRVSLVRFPKDEDSDEFIIGNMKMEIHMMVFHSAESLFLTVLAHYFYPDMPWFWMSTCTQNKFNNIMSVWQEKGLGGIIKEPENWLRDVLYPTINESHQGYQKTKDSATFTKKYLDRLVTEYMRHKEYNAYKNGMRIFPSPAHIDVIDGTSGETATNVQGDSLEYVAYEPQQEGEYEFRMKRALMKFNIGVDINIISTTTKILQNFLERKRVESKTLQGQKGTFNLALFDKVKVEDIFTSDYFEVTV
ncbi:MAG: hypothetical protein M3270_01650 [Thermoproteota archaeon]|nr:hypothetical protein [Thermoproteota archaeon]